MVRHKRSVHRVDDKGSENMRIHTLAKILVASAAFGLSAPASQAADIAVIAGSAQDAFFNIVKKGVDDAALVVEANGGKVSYMTVPNYDNFGPDLVNLINTAVSQNVQGIAIPIWVPDAQVPALQEAAKKGIKVMMYNSGGDNKEKVSGINYFGSDEKIAGVAGGGYMARNGARKVMCVVHVPGAVNLETRCDGVEEGGKANGAEVIRLPLPASLDSNAAGTAEAIKAELLRDPAIDAVIVLGAPIADAAAMAIQQAGVADTVKLGTFDMSASVLNRIKDGTQTMAIDQQPYAQSFLATTMLAAHIDFGIDLATDPVLTGPAIVDASNIDAALNGVSKGAR